MNGYRYQGLNMVVHKNQGVSLVEVLIALLVMGVGVMGFVALQLRSVDTTANTYSRSQAMAIARDMVERINANPNGWPDGYDESAGKWSNTLSDGDPRPCEIYKTCGDMDMAAMDVLDIRRITQEMLFNGRISVSSGCSGSQVACVIVAWEGTTVENCNPEDLSVDGDNANANCVIVEFWPFSPGGSA